MSDFTHKPGDIGIQIRQSWRPTVGYQVSEHGLPIGPILAVVGFLLFFGFMVELVFVPPSNPQGLGPTSLDVPTRPTYPGSYVKIEWHKDTKGAWLLDPLDLSGAVIFNYERLNILVVSEKEIPRHVFRNAEIVRRQTFVLSDSNDLATFLIENEPYNVKVSSGGKQKPYIFYGDVDITSGPLVNQDVAIIGTVSHRGNAHTMTLQTIQSSPRGPPPAPEFLLSIRHHMPTRTVYVIGQIINYSGPNQKHRSSLISTIIDLRPSDGEVDDYLAAEKQWDARMMHMAAQYNVKLEDLKRLQGRRVTVAEGRVVSEPDPRDYGIGPLHIGPDRDSYGSYHEGNDWHDRERTRDVPEAAHPIEVPPI